MVFGAGEIMTMQEVADYLNCHYATVYRLVHQGVFPIFRLGSDYRLRRVDIDRWIESRSCTAGEPNAPRRPWSPAPFLKPRFADNA
jgi:excisionase family DNA binding protein